ncbi:MAG: heat-inducible transcriptional repressor HrcA [Oscillospiraceae bacterium]|jgi:heat-inducible transcriptional repressor|nr:heat-inducible transcriptional repressor HrcA [Oscillospiraceae bacterium]
MAMDERKLRILMAIIDDYIMTAMPVGSRTISKKYDIGGLSSATIRNEMSDLEELGYLDQPHTSAGRIPSAKAYRLYVERLLEGGAPLSANEAQQLRGHFDRRARQVEDVIRSAAQAISDVTRYPAVVTAPRPRMTRIRRVQLVPVTDGAALLLLVTDAGIVKEKVIAVDQQLTVDHLHEIGKMLTDQLAGLPPDAVRERMEALSGSLGPHGRLLAGVLEAVEQAEASPNEIMVGGRSNILHYPEYSDAEKARAVLSVLETRDKLLWLMQAAPQMAFTIRIGDETGMPETSECAVVSMTYRIGDENPGTIGVIGPTRMQYARVIPVLDYMGKALGKLLGEQGGTGG